MAQKPGTAPARTGAGVSTRRSAANLVLAVTDRREMLGEDRSLKRSEERAAARSLADLTLRRLGQIDNVLVQLVEREPKPQVLAALRVMAAELLFGGTPAHAAVTTAVNAVRANGATAKAAGLVNAVGRRLAEEGAAFVETQDAALCNTPGWLRERLNKDWGRTRAGDIVASHADTAPYDLTFASDRDAVEMARETGGRLVQTGSVRIPPRGQISNLPGYEQGVWWVQDAAAALPARLLSAGPEMRVLDLCAAPGGKLMQMVAAGAAVTAVDVSEGRLHRLRQNLSRTGLNAEVVVADALEWEPDAPFDAILLDAPCSATGTIRRHPDLPHRFGKRTLKTLQKLQKDLLNRAADWVAPGGVLVFCTCSLFKVEGEEQASAFLKRRPDFVTVPIETADSMPEEFVTPEGWLRTLPDQWADIGNLDGFFAARFRRTA